MRRLSARQENESYKRSISSSRRISFSPLRENSQYYSPINNQDFQLNDLVPQPITSQEN